jgi:hypothetical protein
MAEDKPDEPNKAPGKPVLLSGKATVRATSSGQLRVRLIQSSPDADPKLVEEARKFERELKEQGSEDPIVYREAPLILPVEK